MNWKDTGAFEAWVEKYQIGPGMNDLHKDPEGDLYSGFDGTVGEGWVPILDRLAADLIAMGWERSVAQIKEKFGTLCFYAEGTTRAMDDRIDQATTESSKTCENCGAPGERRSGGWILTLCDACNAQRETSRRSSSDAS